MFWGLQLIGFLSFPFLATWIRGKRIKLSPIVASYIVGIVIGNLIPDFLDSELSKILVEAAVLLSIPMLLFGSNLKKSVKDGKTLLFAFIIAVSSTLIGVLMAFCTTPEMEFKNIVAGMITGVYTGGTTNLNAVGFALDAPESLFVVLNAFDTVYSGIYLLLIMTILPKILSTFLTNKNYHDANWELTNTDSFNIKSIGLTHVYALIIIALVLGITWILAGKFDGTIIIILLSGIGILSSLAEPIKKLKQTHTVADYWLQVFAIAMGSMARLSDIDWGDFTAFIFLGVVFLVMLSVHFLASKLFNVDIATSLIASTAAVFGPPFIGLVASKMKAEKLILPGIAVAVIGNAFGTYLGLLLAWLL